MENPVMVQPGNEKQGMPGQQMPMTQQPGQYPQPGGVNPGGVMMVQAPPGLDYLASLDRVKILQVLHAVELLTGWERNNQYRLCNEQEQEFLHAKEDTDCMTRQCLGNIRPFQINITNMQGQHVMSLNRDCNCQGCCCPCCLQEMYVEYPPGQRIATVREKWSCMTPRYEIFDAAENLIFKIEGECCYCKCCTDIPFKIFRADGQDAGEVTKHWNGCMEIWGGVNNFSVSYADRNEPLMNRIILLGATFLVDYMYFERNNNN